MEIKNVITIDNFIAKSVSVKTQRVLIEDNGTETVFGLPNRKAYVNSSDGRTELKAELQEPYFLQFLPSGKKYYNNRGEY
ncbi:MAG: hypothetical protein SOT80_09535 [Candidatus Pseudoruminococcus sp.]|uniref:hypothetical protein n=1 Tax=Candidatus Pseudoruminococcus sp. TaxID=3101048 RepID=UPI002A7E555A|nr:hypothetical protein [Ruminococcus sp.]MDY2783617.1 hypothetical protein [Candidatus Pseudoruminococcus sp.]